MANTKLPSRLLDTSAVPALNVTGNVTAARAVLTDGLTDTGQAGSATVFNESGSTADFRIESTGNDNMFVVDGGLNRVGIGTGSPQAHLDINTEAAEATTVILNGEANQDKILKFRHYENSEAAGAGYAGFIGSVISGGILTLGHYDANNAEVQALNINESANVGIGPTSPSYKLDVGHVSSGEIQARFKSSGDTGYTQGAIVLESSDSASSPETRGQGVFMFNNGTDKTWYAGTLYSNPSSYGIGVVGGSTLQTSAADDGSSLAFVIDQSRNVGIGNPNPIAKLDLGVSGVSRNTTADVSTNAYMAGGSSSGGVQYPLTLGRDDNAVTGHMIGMSFDFDDGNWSSTAALVAEVADASTAQTKLKLRTYSGGFKDGLTQHPFGGTTNNLQPGFFARGNTSQWLQGAASSWNTIVSGIGHANGSTIGVNLTEGASGHLNGYDPGGDFNTSNGRFTAPIAGRYLCHGSVYCAKVSNNVNDYMHFLVYVNGQQINQMYTMGGHKQGYPHDFSLNLSTVLNLDTSDYVEWKIYTTSTDMRIYGDHLCIGAHLIS